MGGGRGHLFGSFKSGCEWENLKEKTILRQLGRVGGRWTDGFEVTQKMAAVNVLAAADASNGDIWLATTERCFLTELKDFSMILAAIAFSPSLSLGHSLLFSPHSHRN